MFAELEWIDDTGPAGSALASALPRSAVLFDRFSRAALFRRANADYLDGRLRGKHRRSVRRLGHQLGNMLGGDLELVDRTEEPDALARFLELEVAGWKGKAGTALGSTERGADFFRQMARGFAARGALELLFLEGGGKIAAARCNLRAGPVVFCYKVAHDETLRRFSPGMQLELHMIERFHADHTADRMDSCTAPESQLFNRLWPDRRWLTSALIPTSGAHGRIARPVLKAQATISQRRRAGRA